MIGIIILIILNLFLLANALAVALAHTPCVAATARCMLCACQHAGGSFWREIGGGSPERVGYARRLAHAAGTSADSCDDQGAEDGIGRYPPQQGATASDGSEQGSRGASQSCRAAPPGKHARQAVIAAARKHS